MLSKIRVAQFSKKMTLKLKTRPVDLILLDVLWRKGFIYGYTKIQGSSTIFLRYSLEGLGVLNSIVFLNSELTTLQIKTLIRLDPNYSYLVLTNKGIYVHSVHNSVQGGGRLIAKL